MLNSLKEKQFMLKLLENPNDLLEKYKKIQREKSLGNIEELESEESIDTPRFTLYDKNFQKEIKIE